MPKTKQKKEKWKDRVVDWLLDNFVSKCKQHKAIAVCMIGDRYLCFDCLESLRFDYETWRLNKDKF